MRPRTDDLSEQERALLEPRNPYWVLGLPASATESQIKERYHALALQYHPNKNVKSPKEEKLAAETRFQAINTANETLTDPEKKAAANANIRAIRDHIASGSASSAFIAIQQQQEDYCNFCETLGDSIPDKLEHAALYQNPTAISALMALPKADQDIVIKALQSQSREDFSSLCQIKNRAAAHNLLFLLSHTQLTLVKLKESHANIVQLFCEAPPALSHRLLQAVQKKAKSLEETEAFIAENEASLCLFTGLHPFLVAHFLGKPTTQDALSSVSDYNKRYASFFRLFQTHSDRLARQLTQALEDEAFNPDDVITKNAEALTLLAHIPQPEIVLLETLEGTLQALTTELSKRTGLLGLQKPSTENMIRMLGEHTAKVSTWHALLAQTGIDLNALLSLWTGHHDSFDLLFNTPFDHVSHYVVPLLTESCPTLTVFAQHNPNTFKLFCQVSPRLARRLSLSLEAPPEAQELRRQELERFVTSHQAALLLLSTADPRFIDYLLPQNTNLKETLENLSALMHDYPLSASDISDNLLHWLHIGENAFSQDPSERFALFEKLVRLKQDNPLVFQLLIETPPALSECLAQLHQTGKINQEALATLAKNESDALQAFTDAAKNDETRAENIARLLTETDWTLGGLLSLQKDNPAELDMLCKPLHPHLAAYLFESSTVEAITSQLQELMKTYPALASYCQSSDLNIINNLIQWLKLTKIDPLEALEKLGKKQASRPTLFPLLIETHPVLSGTLCELQKAEKLKTRDFPKLEQDYPRAFAKFVAADARLARSISTLLRADISLNELLQFEEEHPHVSNLLHTTDPAAVQEFVQLGFQTPFELASTQPIAFELFCTASEDLRALLLGFVRSRRLSFQDIATLQTENPRAFSLITRLHPRILKQLTKQQLQGCRTEADHRNVAQLKLSLPELNKLLKQSPSLLALCSTQHDALAKRLSSLFARETLVRLTQLTNTHSKAMAVLCRLRPQAQLSLLVKDTLEANLKELSDLIASNPEIEAGLAAGETDVAETVLSIQAQAASLMPSVYQLLFETPNVLSHHINGLIEQRTISLGTLSLLATHFPTGFKQFATANDTLAKHLVKLLQSNSLKELLVLQHEHPRFFATLSDPALTQRERDTTAVEAAQLLQKDPALFDFLTRSDADLSENLLHLCLADKIDFDGLTSLQQTDPQLFQLFCNASPRAFSVSKQEKRNGTVRYVTQGALNEKDPINLMHDFIAWETNSDNPVAHAHARLLALPATDTTNETPRKFSREQQLHLFLLQKDKRFNTLFTPIAGNMQVNDYPLETLKWVLIHHAMQHLDATHPKDNPGSYWEALEKKIAFIIDITDPRNAHTQAMLGLKNLLTEALLSAGKNMLMIRPDFTCTLQSLANGNDGSRLQKEKIQQLEVVRAELEKNTYDDILKAVESTHPSLEGTTEQASKNLLTTTAQYAEHKQINNNRNVIHGILKQILGIALIGITSLILLGGSIVTAIACLATHRNYFTDSATYIQREVVSSKSSYALFQAHKTAVKQAATTTSSSEQAPTITAH